MKQDSEEGMEENREMKREVGWRWLGQWWRTGEPKQRTIIDLTMILVSVPSRSLDQPRVKLPEEG